MKARLTTALLSATFVLHSAASNAAFTIDFVNNSEFDNDVVNSTATAGGLIVTTVGLSGGALNSTSKGLGIDADGSASSTGDSTREFDSLDELDPAVLEHWTFSFSEDVVIEGLGLDILTGSEQITLSSTAFAGKAFTPGSGSVSFDSGSGDFTLSNITTNVDTYTAADLSTSDSLLVAAGVPITIQAGDNSAAALSFLTISPIPEATSLLTGGLVLSTAVGFLRARGRGTDAE